jgi:hypothetical protein
MPAAVNTKAEIEKMSNELSVMSAVLLQLTFHACLAGRQD